MSIDCVCMGEFLRFEEKCHPLGHPSDKMAAASVNLRDIRQVSP